MNVRWLLLSHCFAKEHMETQGTEETDNHSDLLAVCHHCKEVACLPSLCDWALAKDPNLVTWRVSRTVQ